MPPQSQQPGNQTNNVQSQAQTNLQQLSQAQRQQQLNQLAQQQQQQQHIEANIKQTQPNSSIQNNPMQNQGQNMQPGAQGMPHPQQQMQSGQQQWNFNQINQMQGSAGQNQPANTSQPQQFFGQSGGMNRFDRPQMNNPSKQALSMMLRQRNPPTFMNASNNPQQGANISGLPFNIQHQRQQQLMRSAAMRNVNPTQVQAAAAAAAAAAASNQINNIGNPMMSGGGMIQQRQVNFFGNYSETFVSHK